MLEKKELARSFKLAILYRPDYGIYINPRMK